MKLMTNYLTIKDYHMAIALDADNNSLLSYSYQDGEVNISSQGILTTVNAELGAMIESYFKIKLSDYGVALYDEAIQLETA